ncbi:MAG: serine/threonine-protein kinase, partial [Simkaniaceae bacterium]|nr:serine/threonine-protein kinase [Simkaniaceae bacterium]
YLWDADKIIASYEEKRDAIEKEWDPWVELSSKITIFDQEMMLGSSDNKVKGVADRFFDMMRRLSNAREGMDVYIENARETKRAMELSTTETYPIDPAFNAIAQAIFEEGLSRDKWIGKGGHAVVVANQYGGHEVAKKKNRDDIYYKNELEKAAHLFTAKNELEMATHLLAAKIKGVIHPLYFESKGVIVYPRCDHALDAEIGPKTSTNALDPKQFLFDLVGLLRTLDQLHVRAKVVHSDFKAGNILRKGDQLLIADFGLMGYAGARYEASTMLISAPELLVKRRDRNSNKEVYDFADLPLQPSQDIWALGILLCAALFQEYPFPLPMIESHFFVPENRADFGRVQEQIDRVIDLKFERLAIELMEKDLMETYCTLIKRILRVDPLERPTANALLEMDELKSYLARPAAADAVASDERPVASGAGDI